MVEKLKEEFENQCAINLSNTEDQKELSKKIGISYNTLRRFLGKIESKTQLTTNTLNLISNYIGYNDYNAFKLKDKNKTTINFKTLQPFYDTVKGKGIIMNETRFQNANYQYAKLIFENDTNLNHFFLHFHDNKEALEYVLGWHPCYGRVSKTEYQNLLFKFENKLKFSHIKVFVNSFVFFGKFMSNSLIELDFDLIKKADKEVVKMRKEYDFFLGVSRSQICHCKNTLPFLYKKSTTRKLYKRSYKD
jgi:DNA-binding Xre family transcriptional regulator